MLSIVPPLAYGTTMKIGWWLCALTIEGAASGASKSASEQGGYLASVEFRHLRFPFFLCGQTRNGAFLTADRPVGQYALANKSRRATGLRHADRSVSRRRALARQGGTMSDDIVTLEVSDFVALVTLNRPPVNALNCAMRDASSRSSTSFGTRRHPRRGADRRGQGVLRRRRPEGPARSDKAGPFLEPQPHHARDRQRDPRMRQAGDRCRQRRGARRRARADGLLRYLLAAEEAVFGMPEINVGLAGGASMLRTLFGRSILRRMFFTGHRLTARELFDRDVLEDVVPAGGSAAGGDEDRPRDRLEEPARHRLRQAGREHGRPDAAARCLSLRAELHDGAVEDRGRKEARPAFLEKREPLFKGR